jgi:hypothetical protein
LLDTSAAFHVNLTAASSVALTADRALTFNTENVAHIFTLGTTASTGSGIIFPNTATDTVAMLGVANSFSALTSLKSAIFAYDTTKYTTDGTISNYASNNNVYINGNAAGGLSLKGDGTGYQSISIGGGAANIIQFFTANTEALRINTDQTLSFAKPFTIPGTTLSPYTSLYSADATISNYASNNGVYINGNAAGFLRIAGDGTAHQNITLNGGASSTIVMSTNNTAALTIGTAQQVTIAGTLSAALASAATTSAVCYNTGTGLFTYDGTIGTCTISDETLKNMGERIPNALARLLAINGVYYTWKDPAMGAGRQIGVGAQTVERVFPELVQTDSVGHKSADYQRLTAPIIEALRELKAGNDNLRERVKSLEAAR